MDVTTPNPPLVDAYSDWRYAEAEDDNISTAREIKRQNRRNKFQHFVRRCLTFTNLNPEQPANIAAPQGRPFRWLISSYHLPEEYQAKSVYRDSPWYLLLLCMLVDIYEQLESGIGTSWRDCRVQETGEMKFLRRKDYCQRFPRLKWGRRIVFSEQTKEEPRWLTGRWLIVAYLWSDSREWLRSANVGNLLSFENAFCIRAFERVPYTNCGSYHPYRLFYQSEKVSNKHKRLVTLFRHVGYYPGPYPPRIAPCTSVPDTLSELSRLMNKEAIALLHTPYKVSEG
ncbi:hypothetical protein QBC43DRAFT_202381 [Cladorrhinum sp. PSN259]|nr:hypothetical protein QBC43DRAFT_202381 [Cladorrhinum sp. PSN259]